MSVLTHLQGVHSTGGGGGLILFCLRFPLGGEGDGTAPFLSRFPFPAHRLTNQPHKIATLL